MWPFSTWTWRLDCLGGCSATPSPPCASKLGAGGNYKYCGCPMTPETGCCHMVLTGHLDESGNFIGTGHDTRGDCIACSMAGECMEYDDHPLDSNLDEWLAKCAATRKGMP